MSTAMMVQAPVLATFHGGSIRGALNIRMARFELLADRLVMHEQSRWLMGFGLLGLLLSRILRGARTEILFSQVAMVGRGKFGLNKKILDVTMHDGTVYRLQISDDWAGRVRQQLATQVNLVDAGQERWQVAAA